MERLVFNSSMPKAGSELMQAILHQNPRFFGSATSPLLDFMLAMRSRLTMDECRALPSEQLKAQFAGACSGMAKGFYEAITDRPVVVDKCRGWLSYFEFLSEWNDGPKVVCMVRDLRSILASMERTYRKNQMHPHGPEDPAKMQGVTVRGRVDYWMANIPVGLAVNRLLDAVQRGLGTRVYFVRYEDLCSNPEKTMRGVYAYLGEEYFEAHDFANVRKEVAEDWSQFGPYGRHEIRPVVESATDWSWRDAIPDPVADYVRQQYDWYFRLFGYE